MAQKIIFFDIDGTLIDFKGLMPESTRVALKMAKDRGHKLILCSGRCSCQIYPWLLETGFDGIVGSAGAYVEYQKGIISHSLIPPQILEDLTGYLEQNGAVYLLQSVDHTVASQKSKDRMHDIFANEMGITGERLERLFGIMKIDNEPYRRKDIEKVVYYDSKANLKTIGEHIKEHFDLTPYSFEEPLEDRGEITIKDINKAYGMKKLMEHLHVNREDTVAFGDGHNDYDMIQFAGTSVVMGNGVEELKKGADLVTDDVAHDGIFNAMKKLNLI